MLHKVIRYRIEGLPGSLGSKLLVECTPRTLPRCLRRGEMPENSDAQTADRDAILRLRAAQTEDALRKTEQRYRDLMVHATDGAWLIEYEEPIPLTLPEDEVLARMGRFGQVADCNDAAAHLHGFRDAAAFKGTRAAELLKDLARYNQAKAAVRSGFQCRRAVISRRDRTDRLRHVLTVDSYVVENGALLRAWSLTHQIPDPEPPPRPLNANEDRSLESESGFSTLASADQLRSIAEQMPCVLWTTDTDLRFTSSYGAGLKDLGLKSGEVVGMTLAEYFQGQEHLSTALGAHRQACAGETATYETTAFGRSYTTHLEPMRDAGNSIIGVLGMAFDTTEHKRAEEARKQSEAQLRSIVSHVPGGIWTIDTGLRFTSFYAAERKDLALKPGHVVGMKLEDFFQVVEERQISVAAHRRALSGETVIYESIVYGRTYFNYLEPLTDDTGGITAVLGIALDITDRAQAEEERAILASLVEESPIFIVVARMDGQGVYLNSAARSLVGLTNDEPADARTISDFFAEGQLEQLTRTILPAVRSQGHWAGETLFRHFRTGDLIPVDLLELAIKNPQGEPFRLAAVARDLPERKRTERQKSELEAQLIQAQKMEALGRLSGGIAHDFNNSLTVILGQAAIAKSTGGLSTQLMTALEGIEKAGIKSRDLVRQLLGFSRRQVIAPKPMDVNDAFREIQNTVERLMGEDIELRVHLGDGLWRVMLDSSQFDQVIMNLAANARDAMPEGGRLAIETANASIDEEYARHNPPARAGEYVHLMVSDSGIGMDHETISHLFEPFFTTKKEGKGTGLGLATIYGIVNQNNGFVNVQSKPGGGSRFSIYLPRLVENGVVEKAREEKAGPSAASTGCTILLVEDDRLVREITATFLTSIGHTPLIANSPYHAIELCGNLETSIDLVMSDVVMPKMTGPELRDRLVAIRPKLKVLFTSGYTSDVVGRHGVLKPGVSFLQKPFTIDELAAKISEVISSEPGPLAH